jgi:hypothetical protein
MNDFRTRDFPIAAFLLARGHRIVATTRSGNSIWFHFAPAASYEAPQYLADVEVPCRTFYAAIKELKSLIHGSRDLANSIKETNEHTDSAP